MKITARIVAALASSKVAEHAVIGWGFTQKEIDAAVKSGAVRRIGNQMGASTIRYLSAV